MTINEGLRMIAGFFVMLSVALGYWIHPGFFLFTAFVGANLFQSAFTHWCPMMWILEKVGLSKEAKEEPHHEDHSRHVPVSSPTA